MIKQRAIEISESPIMANVTYNDIPVYIQKVSDQNETARIFPLDDPQDEKEVNLSSLIEH
ncbi:H-type small acid-soluble spore protein [Halalkalibacter alkalisediminis]|uniref:Small, acid-soluble spore protein H n=1 Tax=Halalkalibacter alkalisediminis TaxID=935616 RepID=A0ABV6NH87_9BACI|nr:H-type small acid-soluble spore protein [Halalkalibacter alkalisediminis]